MRIVPILLIAHLFAMSAAAHAEKKIYKCTDASGSSVFSPYPCGAGAQEMKVETTAPPSLPVTPDRPASAPALATTPAAPPAPVDEAEDIKCEQAAERLKVYPERANLDMLLKRQAEQMRAYASSASESTKVLIGNMDATIATEQARIDDGRQRADRAYTKAFDKCQARKAAREQQASKP
jgi:hypothetical protein